MELYKVLRTDAEEPQREDERQHLAVLEDGNAPHYHKQEHTDRDLNKNELFELKISLPFRK
jgi:hypothetical protein